MTLLANTIAQLSPMEQSELWRRFQEYNDQFRISGREILAGYKPELDPSIPNRENPLIEDFFRSVTAKGGADSGFLQAVLDGDLQKLIPKGKNLGAAGPVSEKKQEVIEEKKEEKTAFNLVLKSFTQESKLKLIKEVKTMLNIGLKEAKDQVEASQKAPVVLYKNLPKAEAEAKLKKLKETGADLILE